MKQKVNNYWLYKSHVISEETLDKQWQWLYIYDDHKYTGWPIKKYKDLLNFTLGYHIKFNHSL